MRHQDWPERLHNIIVALADKPFAWGTHDCCSFAASVVHELTDDDHFTPFVGAYSTALEAARVLKQHGGVRGIASAALGTEIPPLTAQRGDVALVSGAHGDTLAICTGSHCVAPGITWLEYVPMTAAVTAWRVR